MSAGRKTVTYAALAVVLAGIIILASMFFIAGSGPASSTSHSSSQIAGQSVLAIQLTDPPQVPQDTRSLNLTYSAVSLLVGEPASNGQVTTISVSLTPSGGSATVDLLKLQNVSQTVASTSLPTGSTIYTISFTVQNISININGTVQPVTLATGGTTLGVTLAHPALLGGDSAVLLELNPVVADTPTGYQLIPSMVGILKPPSEYHPGDESVGTKQQVSQGDNQGLDQASGQITARLVSLSVSGTMTSLTVQVNNTGSVPVTLVAIGLHGNFTSQSGCPGNSGQHGNGNQNNGNGNQNNGNGNQNNGNGGSAHSCGGHNEVVFSPVVPATTSTTSSTHLTTCSTARLALSSGEGSGDGDNNGLTIEPGHCLALTFSGSIAFGQSAPIVPSTMAGQVYVVHVVASDGANIKTSCSLPLTATSCTPAT